MLYPDGAVRTTPLRGVQDSNNSITLADLLDAKHLHHAVLTTFVVDERWLLSHFGTGVTAKVALTLVANAHVLHSDSTPDSHVTIRRVRPEFPKPSVQIVHSKFILLVFADYMRFAACTGNLIEDDWTIMHNSVYIQDFPMDDARVFPANDFSLSLAYALLDLSIPFDFVARLNQVDFSKAAGVHIVTSVPTGSTRQNANMSEYGMLRMAQVIEQIYGSRSVANGFDPDTRVYYVGSSLGRLDYRWLREFYLCAHGIKPHTMRKYVFDYSTPNDMVDVGIAFHTQAQVKACQYADQCAQYIIANQSAYEARDFPRDAMLRIEPLQNNTLVHAKVMVARVGVDQDAGWVYIGSHNCTMAAWGTLRGKEPPYFNNYEFGVILSGVRFVNLDGSKAVRAVWKDQTLPLPFNVEWNPYFRDDAPYFASQK
ncbi:hypothetical protein GGI20_006126 [Coemansia sp. BCRC 34301]|nr:hypothetical protein GGI20_006126 [Coemansia sp. BCRC 34301]